MDRYRKLMMVGCLAAMLLQGRALAQVVYNPDGTPSMIAPDGSFTRDGVRDASLGGSGYGQSNQPMPETGAQPVEERFDIDCDPDLDVCVDPHAQPAYDDGYSPDAYQQFQGALQPYGDWSEDATYGEVWTPSSDVVGADFEPYSTDGEWVASSDYGFAWASDYDWGWAPFHYGRWLWLDGRGWCWIPGTIWGPAWVDWRYGGGYVGWAALPPAGVIVRPPAAHGGGGHSSWRFALATELMHRNPTFVPTHVAASVYLRTKPVNNMRTVALGGVNAKIPLGPSLALVSHDTGRVVPALGLRSAAPSVLPRQTIVARAGVGLAQRGYVRAAVPIGTSGVLRARTGYEPRSASQSYHYGNSNAPIYRPSNQPVQYHQQGYAPAPGYRAPTQGYAPTYHAPSTSYTQSAQPYREPSYAPAPTYHAPAPSYRAPEPSYRAPEPTYHAPAPSYHAPEPAYHAPEPSYHPPVSAPSPSFGGSNTRRRR